MAYIHRKVEIEWATNKIRKASGVKNNIGFP